MNDLTLYGMASELSQIEQLMNEDEFFEDSEENQALIAKRSQELIELLTNKADAVCGYNASIDDYLEAINQRISELQDLKKKVQKKQENFHSYILNSLDALGMKKINGNLYSISYRKPSQLVEITNENLLPSRYIKIKEVVDIDKRQLGEDLKEGQLIEGAQLKEGKRSLTFRAGK